MARDTRVLVAVSGGADSVALLRALHSVAPEFGITLHVAHLHHRLRGADADADLAFVRALCGTLGVPLTTARWNTRARMKRRGLTGQNGLRTLRRAFLTQAARRAGAAFIATAHTADDQLETVLLRLARGTGVPGLGGMSARAGIWIRPLLEATRGEIEADLDRIGQPWREDRSNQDLRYARNWIRHRVVPALAAAVAGPGSRSALGIPDDSRTDAARRAGLARKVAHSAREVREARRALAGVSGRIARRLGRIEGAQITLDSSRLRSYPSAVQRNVLRRSWSRLPGVRSGLTGPHLDLLLGLVARPSRTAEAGLPDRRSARCDATGLVLGPSGRSSRPIRHPKKWGTPTR
jgi:tRNA(Ile)-lysidine synthase